MGGVMCHNASSEAPFSADIIDSLAQETRFPRETLIKLHTLFYADYPNGCISKKGFLNAICFDPSDPLYTERLAIASNIFNLFNTTRDGVMNFQQYVRALGVLQNGSFNDKVAKAFEIYDYNHKQTLSSAEIGAVWRCSDDERHQGLGEDVIQQRINLLDSDSDGKLSKSDFLSAHKLDPQILHSVMETNIVETLIYKVTHGGNEDGGNTISPLSNGLGDNLAHPGNHEN